MENKEQKNRKLPWIVAGVIVLAAVVVYIGTAVYFQNRFLLNTTVNGVKASGRSWEEVEKEMLAELDSYSLTITGRKEITDTIRSQDIDMQMDFGSLVQDAQNSQNAWTWPRYLFKGDEITLKSVVIFDETKLEEQVAAMNCMNKKQAAAPVNAHISKYDKDKGFTIVKEEENNQLVEKTFKSLVVNALESLDAEITTQDLEDADAYKHPSVYSDDKNLLSQLDTMNQIAKITLTYKFGDQTETLKGDTIAGWLKAGKKGSVSVDSDQAREYVNTLARKYDTFGGNGSRSFKTSYGSTVKISGGDYGWWTDRSATTEALVKAIKEAKDQTLEVTYNQTAASYGEQDYGDTYVEINLTAQHLFLYKNGKKILETNFVSGAPYNKLTPAGVYGITYKERAHTMNGDPSDPYRVETSFWMPYAGNIGMHDATWRNRFGGTLYRTGGSHGCVNLPYNAAKKIYETVDKGTPVICYHLDGTSSSVSTQSDQEIANIGIDAIDRIGTVSKKNYSIVKKRIEWARQVYTDLSSNQRRYVNNYQKLVEAEKALKNLW